MGRRATAAATSHPARHGVNVRNVAAELGPARFKWWQDWRGECVAIVASGPSTTKADVETLRDRIHVIAIKKNVELCPWADVVYGCDEAWWNHVRGLPDYRGVKLSHAPRACARFADVQRIGIPNPAADRMITGEPGVIGSGGNSGFQAVNLAVQFGATAILLLGFDMHGRSGAHWYGRNGWDMANNPSDSNFGRWLNAFKLVAPELKSRGVDVVNVSPHSAIDCFPKMSIADALKRWGL